MDKKVVIYTSATCGYCHMAMDYFNEKGIEFVEKNVSTDANARKELMSQGFMGVPVIFVGDEIVQGFDKNKLEELLS